MSTPEESFLVGLIGSGITASLTPPMHEYAADQLGIRYLYRPLDIDKLGPKSDSYLEKDPATLLAWGLKLGYNAFNITYPYKQSVLPHLGSVTSTAHRLGSVNTVVLRGGETEGHNTDVSGYRTALQAGLAPTPGDIHTVTQLGVGGAGSATADALLSLGTRVLFLYDTDPARSQAKAQELSNHYPTATITALAIEGLPEAIASSQGLVNATPIGMHHHPGSPLPLNLLRRELWVSDVIYLPQKTALIQRASELGCQVLPGGLMAVGQAVDAFELITGHRPTVESMLPYFSQLLNKQGNRLT